jgi:hypothetical protein
MDLQYRYEILIPKATDADFSALVSRVFNCITAYTLWNGRCLLGVTTSEADLFILSFGQRPAS